MATVGSVIDQAATKYGVPPILAEATAWQESNLNPLAVSPDSSSLGLFQLAKGGELGSLTEDQALDPEINADTALARFAEVKRQNPDVAGGVWAALAQRPADPSHYAASIDALIRAIPTGRITPEFNQALAAEVGGVTDPPTDPPEVSEPAPSVPPSTEQADSPLPPAPPPDPTRPEVTYCTPSLPELRQGQRGYPVRVLQTLLAGSLVVDGIFGPATLASLLSFQRSKALPESGVVDIMTWQDLIGRQVEWNN